MSEIARRTKRRKKAKNQNSTPLELGPVMRRLKKNACYVLITCDEPSEDGRMNVEMTYEGDDVLASYLLENAQSIIDKAIETSLSQ